MSFLYAVLADTAVGMIGIWRDREEVDKIVQKYKYANLIVIQYPSMDAKSEFAWVVPCECPEGCVLMVGDNEAYVKDYADGFIKLHRCPEDYVTADFKYTIGTPREEKIALLEKIELILGEYGPDVQTMDQISREEILTHLFSS